MQFICSSRKWGSIISMPYIEILNILTISCNTKGTEEADKYTNLVQTYHLPMVQEVSSAMQIQSQKFASQKGADTHARDYCVYFSFPCIIK